LYIKLAVGLCLTAQSHEVRHGTFMNGAMSVLKKVSDFGAFWISGVQIKDA
jgi:hypothetical protein